jgi:MFS family permease
MFSYLNILRRRNFLFLWIGQVISQFGDRLTQMALIGLVYRLEPGSSLQLAKMMSLAIIPVFLVSPVAGVYVDRWDKRKTMYVSDFVRGVLIIMIPFLMDTHSLLPIYVIIFLSFCMGRFFIPAKMAIIPELVQGKSLLLTNSLFSITAMIAAVIGFGLGGIIVEKWGTKAAFLIDACTFFISAICVILMKFTEKKQFHAKDILDLGRDAILKVKNSFLHETKEGITYILKSKETLYSARVMFVLFASIGSLYTVFIVFLQHTLSTITMDIGWLAVGAGAGLFFGSLAYGKLGAKIPIKNVVNVSMFLASAFLCFFACALKANPNKTFAFYSCVFLGILISPIVIAVNTLIHKESENGFWGRIFSYIEVLIHIAFLAFMFTASYLAEKTSPFTVIVWVGILILAFSTINIAISIFNRQKA